MWEEKTWRLYVDFFLSTSSQEHFKPEKAARSLRGSSYRFARLVDQRNETCKDCLGM